MYQTKIKIPSATGKRRKAVKGSQWCTFARSISSNLHYASDITNEGSSYISNEDVVRSTSLKMRHNAFAQVRENISSSSVANFEKWKIKMRHLDLLKSIHRCYYRFLQLNTLAITKPCGDTGILFEEDVEKQQLLCSNTTSMWELACVRELMTFLSCPGLFPWRHQSNWWAHIFPSH